ncbi:MAG: hypothetical protein WBJ17_00030 [Natronincolaceae bacterium]
MDNNKKGWFKNLTPKLAWEHYVGTSVELFLSNFREDGIHDIKEMCRDYAQEVPMMASGLFSQDQIDLIGNLIMEYIMEYAKERGGIDNLRLYTAQELDDIFDSMSMDIKRYLLRGGTSIISKRIESLYWKPKIEYANKNIKSVSDIKNVDDFKNHKLFIVTTDGRRIAEIEDFDTLSNTVIEHNEALNELIELIDSYYDRPKKS